MKTAYVDTSCLVAVAFGEPGSDEMAHRLESYGLLVGSNLVEAELRSAFVRERVAPDHPILTWIRWVLPNRPLSPEMTAVLSAGRVRGADLWHLACALYVAGAPRDLPFLTLDQKQAEVARRLGFPT